MVGEEPDTPAPLFLRVKQAHGLARVRQNRCVNQSPDKTLKWRHAAQWLRVTVVLLAAAVTALGQATAAPVQHGTALVREETRGLRDSLAPQIEAVQRSYSIPALSLVVVRDGDVLWAEGFGHADRSRGTAATPDTIYRAGSLAKPFTALAVMRLVEGGVIDLERPLQDYLPGLAIRSRFDRNAPLPTVRNVLTHHAGLPTDLTKGMWTDAPFTAVATALGEEYTAFPPNLVFSYSNIGYTLLGHLVQRVTGVPFAQHIDQAVFVPLGLSQTSMGPRPEMERLLAKGYRDGREARRLPIRDLPALGLYTSASDLGRFMTAALAAIRANTAAVVTGRTWRQMLEPQNRGVALDLHITTGLGWFLEEGTIPGAGPVVRHGGTTLAYSSELILLPEQGLGVAVLANSHGSRTVVATLAEEILRRLLGTEGEPGESGRLTATVSRKVDDARRADLAGSYATDFGLITISPEQKQLCACLMDQVLDLVEYPDGWFGLSTAAVASLPEGMAALRGARLRAQEVGGREVIVATTGEQRVVLGEKVASKPIPPAWQERIGHYEVVNPDEGFPLIEPGLKIRQGLLCMSYKLPVLSDQTIQVPLQPISDSEAIILGLGRTRGETVRAVPVDGQEGLRYSGFIVRKLPDAGG